MDWILKLRCKINTHDKLSSQCSKARNGKIQKRDTFTLWENAHTHNPSICGVYLSYWELYTKYRSSGGQNKYTINFPVVFNYDDLLPFIGFDEFPNCTFGNFSITARITQKH
jgi:hypothetical protein